MDTHTVRLLFFTHVLLKLERADRIHHIFCMEVNKFKAWFSSLVYNLVIKNIISFITCRFIPLLLEIFPLFFFSIIKGAITSYCLFVVGYK
jgi:hypothetical protein